MLFAAQPTTPNCQNVPQHVSTNTVRDIEKKPVLFLQHWLNLFGSCWGKYVFLATFQFKISPRLLKTPQSFFDHLLPLAYPQPQRAREFSQTLTEKPHAHAASVNTTNTIISLKSTTSDVHFGDDYLCLEYWNVEVKV